MVSIVPRLLVDKIKKADVFVRALTNKPRESNFRRNMTLSRASCLRSQHMMTSSNGNKFRIAGPLSGESTALRKISGAELWYVLCSAWTNGWAKYRDAGDLRRLSTHYDDKIMIIFTQLNQPHCKFPDWL